MSISLNPKHGDYCEDPECVTALGMESKLGENFLSLQCKDRATYPLPPSIFTEEFSPSASYERREQEIFH